MLKLVESICLVDEEGRVANVRWALTRGLPTCARTPRRKGALAIVGCGPSVNDYADALRAWPGEIWAINGAWKFLHEELGIVAHGHVILDPGAGMTEYITPHPQTTYYVASVCEPPVFDHLSGQDVWLWHTKLGAAMPYPPHTMVIGGGTTALTRAPFLGNLLGWRDMTIFGADSSCVGEEFYCYRHGTFEGDAKRQDFIRVAVGEQVFVTNLQMAKQVPQIADMVGVFNGQLKVRCGGLMAAFLAAPIHDISEFTTEPINGTCA